MARSYTIVDMRARCRETADVESGSYFIDDTELDALINQKLSDLYDLLIETAPENFVKPLGGLGSVPSLVTTPGNPRVSLHNMEQGSFENTNFYLLRGVDIQVGDRMRELVPFQFKDRHRYANTGVSSPNNGPTGVPVAYRLETTMDTTWQDNQAGAYLRLFPTPDAAYNLEVWYIPHAPVLVAGPVATADTYSQVTSWDGFNGWEEFVFVAVAAAVMTKQQRDPGPFLLRREQIMNRIRAKTNRDLSVMMGQVNDVEGGYGYDEDYLDSFAVRRP